MFIKLTVVLLTYKFKSCKVINFYSINFVLSIIPLRIEWKNCSYILLFHSIFIVLGEVVEWSCGFHVSFCRVFWHHGKCIVNFPFLSSKTARVSWALSMHNLRCCFESEHHAIVTEFYPEYKLTLPFSCNGERLLPCNDVYFVVF